MTKWVFAHVLQVKAVQSANLHKSYKPSLFAECVASDPQMTYVDSEGSDQPAAYALIRFLNDHIYLPDYG